MTQLSHAGFDQAKRYKKARKLRAVIEDFVDFTSCNVLDIGTGSGHIAHELARYCKKLTSIDVNDERIVKTGYSFKKVKDENLPFDKNTFDVVISNQVIEHILNKEKHMIEIWRVLKKRGICYLATPNKYWIIEPHYHLPFLSWLPNRIANHYLMALLGKTWDVSSLSYSSLKKLTGKFRSRSDMIPTILKNPRKYNLDVYVPFQCILKVIPKSITRTCVPIMPSFIFVLQK